MMEKNKLGMILFVLSEAVFFLMLIAAYIFYHRTGGEGPTAANSLDPIKSGLFSVALLSSSVTMWRSNVCARKGDRPGVAIWLAATIGLGTIFLLGQGSEYIHLLGAHVTISKNLFGTTFFTLTGFHGFHVLVGLIMLLIMFAMAWGGNGREPGAPALEVIAIYWHFVDAVWVVIFSIVYLWAFL